MKVREKRAQFNFGWLFAIIVGGAILFLAIYGAMKTGDTAKYQSDTATAKSISVLTDPLQAGFSEGSYGSITFRKKTRITNLCYDQEFGKNDLSVSTRSDIGEEWSVSGSETSIYNKYIFSPETNEAKSFYVFSKPLYLPYKVADLVYLISDNYCFLGAPEDIADELSAFNIPNIQVDNCTLPNQTKVCFKRQDDCDIKVIGSCDSCDSLTQSGTVEGPSGEFYYSGEALMYAAIFSDKTNYKCNVQRLLYRGQKIAEELIQKSELMSSRGCPSILDSDLFSWKTSLNSTSPDDTEWLYDMSQEMNKKNERAGECSLW